MSVKWQLIIATKHCPELSQVMENTSNNFNTLFSDNTDLNADSVEWCPHIPNQNVFVCGNYQLIEETEVYLI